MPNLKKGWEDLRAHRCIHTLFSTIGNKNEFLKYSFYNLRKVQSTIEFGKMLRQSDLNFFFLGKKWVKNG